MVLGSVEEVAGLTLATAADSNNQADFGPYVTFPGTLEEPAMQTSRRTFIRSIIIRILVTLGCFLGILGIACNKTSETPPQGTAATQETQPAVGRERYEVPEGFPDVKFLPASEPQAEHRARTTLLPEGSARVTSLKRLLHGSLQNALAGLKQSGQEWPSTEAELAAFAFCWPLANLESGAPLPIVPASDLPGVGKATTWPCGLGASFQFKADSLEIETVVPIPASNAVATDDVIPTVMGRGPFSLQAKTLPKPAVAARDPQVAHAPDAPALLAPETTLAYRDQRLALTEARPATLQKTCIHVIKHACTVLGKIPTTWAELRAGSGLTLINVVDAPDPASATLAIYTDERQAYRFVLTYPSGLIQDSTLDFWQVSMGNAHYREVPTLEWEAATGRKAQKLLAAFSIVPVEQASLPRGSCE